MKVLSKLANALGVIVSKDEKLAFLFYRKSVLYDTNDFSEVWNLTVPPYTTCAAISNDNSILAIKNCSGKISLWDIKNKVLIKNFPMKKLPGENCLFSPDDRYLVDADVDGNIMVIDKETLTFKVINKYCGSMINGITFNYDTNEFIFSFLEKNTDLSMAKTKKHAVIWKYPFEENEPVNQLIPAEVGEFSPIRNIPNSTKYYSYTEKELIILNSIFEIESKIPIKLDYGFKPICSSKDGKYILTIKHGINLYSLNTLNLISDHFIKGAIDVAFFNNNKIIVASKYGSYVMELS